jgi:hypothetical protein
VVAGLEVAHPQLCVCHWQLLDLKLGLVEERLLQVEQQSLDLVLEHHRGFEERSQSSEPGVESSRLMLAEELDKVQQLEEVEEDNYMVVFLHRFELAVHMPHRVEEHGHREVNALLG